MLSMMLMKNIEKLRNTVMRLAPEIVETRHKLHTIPELAGEEHQTSEFIRKTLADLDVEIQEPLLGTDVIAMIKGSGPGKNVTLRADIDGLPVTEKTELPYRSVRDGFMHACGHDGHTAVLLGVARTLTEMRDEFPGSVRLVFQPGEEVAALGKQLVEKGALRNPEPDVVLAMHGWTGIEPGAIASMPGPMMAAAGFFKITINGKGAHGSKPEQSVDPITIATILVQELNAIPARSVSALEQVVVSVCSLHSGVNSNVIPDTAQIEGTFRFLNPKFSKTLPALMEQTAKNICMAKGATCDFSYTIPYIPLVNNAHVVEVCREVVRDMPDCGPWFDMHKPVMGGEDFAYYITDYPGAIFWLGMGAGADRPYIHSPFYDFNDEAIPSGMLFMAASTLKFLR